MPARQEDVADRDRFARASRARGLRQENPLRSQQREENQESAESDSARNERVLVQRAAELAGAGGPGADEALRALGRALALVLERPSQQRFVRGLLCYRGRLSVSQGRAMLDVARDWLRGQSLALERVQEGRACARSATGMADLVAEALGRAQRAEVEAEQARLTKQRAVMLQLKALAKAEEARKRRGRLGS